VSLTRGTPGNPDAVEATVCRAEPIHVGAGDRTATIYVTEPQPQDLGPASSLDDYYTRWRDDAEAIHAALSHALPGGTLDALFALMAAERASAYVVPARYHDTAGKLRELIAGVDALVELHEGGPAEVEDALRAESGSS